MDHFVRPEHRAIVEYVKLDGSFSDTPPGRTMVPGHGIESMWFQLHIFRERSIPGEINRASEAMEWCLEKGWDRDYGGIFLGLDICGHEPPFWKHATAKIWWVAGESLAATLLAYEADPRATWLAHHSRIAKWALQRFPVREHGDCRQRLDRQGNVLREIVALPVKDPFHLPRGLIVAIETHARLAAAGRFQASPPKSILPPAGREEA